MEIVRIACGDTVYSGHHYRPGDPWLPEDGGDPPSPEDGFAIRHQEPEPGPQADGVSTGSSKGYVQWRPQPERPRPKPLTPEELAILEKDPYANLDEVPGAAAVSEPASGEKEPAPTRVVNTLGMSDEELDKYYKDRDAAKK